ncbi:MAG: imidazole glycerol phosphate synthase subunit HisF [Clostridium sp.]|nr:imidazole glycerol phosphate synthase subunit HisF [Clostridium sp.]
MLTKRIIPCLDVQNGRVVKGVNFTNMKDAGDPVEIAEIYDKAGADEIILLDIGASPGSRNSIIDMIKKVAGRIEIPFTVGGGIRTVADLEEVLDAGADKISINTAAVKNPDLLSEAASRFGNQCIVVAIDAKKRSDGSGWDVYINGGKHNTGKDVIEWVFELEELGAGEILLTSMDRDGTRDGYDIELVQKVAKSVMIPIIASGGAGRMEHFYEALKEGEADAALAASLFHFKEVEIMELKNYLRDKGIEVRI